MLLNHGEGTGAVMRLIGCVAHLFEIGARDFNQFDFIIHYEDPAGEFGCRDSRTDGIGRLRAPRCEGQIK